MSRRSWALVAFLAAGCVRATSETDLLRFQRLASAAVAPIEKPLWSTATQGSNVALLVPLPGRGLLVASTRMQKLGMHLFARVPRVAQIALYELETGRALWQREVDASGDEAALVATEPTLVLAFRGSLRAFDPATGREVWRLDHQVLAHAVDAARGTVLTWVQGKRDEGRPPRAAIVAVALADGQERWRADIPGSVAEEVGSVTLHGDRFMVVGRGVALYGLGDGRLVSEPLGAPDAMALPVKRLGVEGGVVLGDREGRLAYVRLDGAVRWRTKLSRPVDHLAAQGSDLLAVGASGTSATLRLLALDTGKELWARDEELMAGAPAFAADSLVYSTSSRVVLVDRSSGRELAAAPRSDAMRRGLLGDRVLVRGDQATVAGETGMMAVGLGGRSRPGAVLWRMDLRGTDESTLAARRGHAALASIKYRPRSEAAADAEALERALVDMRRNDALRYGLLSVGPAPAAAVQRAWDPASMSALSASQRLEMAKVSHTLSQADAQIQLSAATLSATVGLAGTFVAAQRAARLDVDAAQRIRSEAAIRRALELWALSVQGDYVVRPIGWDFGAGVLVVDARTGRWIELVTSPGEPALHDLYVQYPPALLDERGGRLYTLAIAPGPTPMKEFPSLTLAVRSAAAFSLADASAWNAPEEYAARSRFPPSRLELRAAK